MVKIHESDYDPAHVGKVEALEGAQESRAEQRAVVWLERDLKEGMGA